MPFAVATKGYPCIPAVGLSLDVSSVHMSQGVHVWLLHGSRLYTHSLHTLYGKTDKQKTSGFYKPFWIMPAIWKTIMQNWTNKSHNASASCSPSEDILCKCLQERSMVHEDRLFLRYSILITLSVRSK